RKTAGAASRGSKRAFVFLRLVLELHLTEIERELVGRHMGRAVRAAGLIRAHDQIFESPHVVVLLALALLADEQLRLLDVRAGRAGEEQQRARLAAGCGEVAVLEVNLASAATAADWGGAVVRSAP